MRCTRARGFRRRRQPLAWALGVGTCMPHVRLRLGTESESEGTKKMLCAYLPNFAHRFYSISFVPRPIYLRRLRSAQCVSRTRPMDTGRYTSPSHTMHHRVAQGFRERLQVDSVIAFGLEVRWYAI